MSIICVFVLVNPTAADSQPAEEDILAVGVSSDKDAVHASFWNWTAVSSVCLYFPRHFCNCHSQNALWLLLACRAAMCYWLRVRNHLAHLLCKTIQSHLPEHIVCLLSLKHEACLSLFWFDRGNMIWKLIHFKIFVWTLSQLSGAWFSSCDWICLLCESWMTCYLRSVRPVSLPFAPQRSPLLLIDTVHCVCNHVSCKTLPRRWKRTFWIQMWQMASLRFCQYSLCTC